MGVITFVSEIFDFPSNEYSEKYDEKSKNTRKINFSHKSDKPVNIEVLNVRNGLNLQNNTTLLIIGWILSLILMNSTQN